MTTANNINDEPLAARAANFDLGHGAESRLEINDIAPDFSARTTQGTIRFSDYAGRWVVLFAHPADFTPVCTSEFIAFQKAKPTFDDAGAQLLGLSVDSLYAHLAWIRDIEMRFGVQIDFPVIEDISMAVARAYGMIHDRSVSTATVRSVFFIDPDQRVRAIIHYPMNVGRSVDEILRVLLALQATEQDGAVTPEGWRQGEPTLPSPPSDQWAAAASADNGSACWYYAPTEGGGASRR